MDLSKMCIDCFGNTGGEDVCMNCGFVQSNASEYENVLMPRTVLNKYVIGRVISMNAQSVLYKAFDMNLDRVVAIREYYPAGIGLAGRLNGSNIVFSDDDRAEEFERRKQDFLTCSQAIRRSAHDNIVTFYDEFEANGTAYQVIEYLDGITLEQYCAQVQKLSFEEALDIMMPVMDALSTLHSGSGITFRSFSPKNVFITLNGEIKVAGLNHIYLSEGVNYIDAPAVNDGYSAPEVYANKAITEASDVYSLGAVWYRLLAGVTPPAASLGKKRDKLLASMSKDGNVPAFADAVIHKAMSLDPSARFADIEAFSESLRGEGWQPKKKKSKVSVIIACIAAVLILAAGVTAMFFISSSSIVPSKDTEITLWYPKDANAQVNERWDAIADAYAEQVARANKLRDVKVTLKTKGIDRGKYKEKLEKALKDGSAPDIYCSDELTSNSKAASLEKLYSEIDASGTEYNGAFSDMRKIFEEDNRIALCWDTNVLYVSTKGKSKDIPKKSDGLKTLMDWKDDGRSFSDPFVCSPDSVLFAAYSYGYKDGGDTDTLKDLFDEAQVDEKWIPSDIVNQSTKSCIARVSDYDDFYSRTEDFRMIPLTGEKTESYYIYPEVWSINKNASEDEQKAAVYLLYYLISSTEGQKNVCEVGNKTYYLPFNKAAADKLETVYREFVDDEGIKNVKSAADYAFRTTKARGLEELALKTGKDKDKEFNKLAKTKKK